MLISHFFNFLYLSEDHQSRVFSNWVGQYLVLLFKSVIPHACLKETAYTVIKRENLSSVKVVKKRRWWMNSAKMCQHEMLLDILFPWEMLLWCYLLAKERELVYLYHICVLVGRNGRKNNQQLIYYNGPIWKGSCSSWQQGKEEQEQQMIFSIWHLNSFDLKCHPKV